MSALQTQVSMGSNDMRVDTYTNILKRANPCSNSTVFRCVLPSYLVLVCLPLLSQEQVLNIKPEHPKFSQTHSADDEKKNKRKGPFSCGFSYCILPQLPPYFRAVAGFTALITGLFTVCLWMLSS